MRSWIVVALALAAGCLDAPDAPGADAGSLPAAEPFTLEGTVWLPPSQGSERVESLVPFNVTGGDASLAIHLALGSAYGPAELPVTSASVEVELRAPDGEVLAAASMSLDGREAQMAVDAAPGEYTLAILSFGGSDGSANGDHVHYMIEGTPAAASGA